jgi:hypothetical protein
MADIAFTTASVGAAPFGFDFDRAGHLLVSDAALTTGCSGADSYDVAADGTVTANGPAVPIDQAAACWPAAADGFAYTANAGSGWIGRYAVAPDGTHTSRSAARWRRKPGVVRTRRRRRRRPELPVRRGQRSCRRSSATRSAPTGRSPR